MEKPNLKNIPQPGPESGIQILTEGINFINRNGKEKEVNCKLEKSEYLSIKDIFSSEEIDISSIPYYKDVHEDLEKGDRKWTVAQKVEEYADFLAKNPETINDFPPIQFLDGKLFDGAHRISTLYLLSKKHSNSNWAKVKLRVDFYKSKKEK